MSHALATSGSLALTLATAGGAAALSLPFGREIRCLDCPIAGIAFHDAVSVANQLEPDAVLSLRRDPDNAHDASCVAVLAGDALVGYVPRRCNEMLARLMDAGKSFTARVVERKERGSWMEVRIRVFLRDL